MTSDTRELSKRLALVALPVMLQSLVQTSVGLLDTLMIGQLGETEIAAVGSANQFFFLVQIFFYGINSGSSIFLAQYFGARDWKGMRKVSSLAVLLATLGGALCALVSVFFPTSFLSFFSKDPAVLAHGRTYLLAVAVSYPFAGFSFIWSGGFRAGGDARTPLLTTLFSLLLNAVLNILLIFGPGPFPALGVLGAAIATAVARIMEALVLLFISVKRHSVFLFREKEDFHWDRVFLRDFGRTALPVFADDVLWALGTTLYKIAFSLPGTAALAAININMSLADFFSIGSMGLANGAAILIGNVTGEGDREKAERWGRKIFVIAILQGLFLWVLQSALAPSLVSLFNVSSTVKETAVLALYAMAFVQALESPSFITIIGTLRGGGDTSFALAAEIIPMYFLAIPLVFIGAIFFHLPLWALCLLKAAEMGTKTVLSGIRLKNGRWVNVLTKG